MMRAVTAAWFAGCATLGLWVAWMYLDDAPPYMWSAGESYVSPQPAADGGMIAVSWKMKVNRLCPGSSQRILVDANTGQTVATYDATPAALSVSTGDERLIRTFQLPRGLPPLVGYRSTVCFRCNLLQAAFPLCITTPTLIFAVVPREEK